jgi:hypothetical protein
LVGGFISPPMPRIRNPLVESGNGREERYLIVAFTVMTDVPEAVGP